MAPLVGLGGEGARKNLGGLVRKVGRDSRFDRHEVAVDRGFLAWEPRNERFSKGTPTRWEVVDVAVNDDSIVDLTHIGPLNLAVANLIEDSPGG